jgi:hypothetical protein
MRALAGGTPAVADAAVPTAPVYAPKGAPPGAGGVAPAAEIYKYAGVRQYAVTTGMSALVTVARPELWAGDFHTLAELAAQSADRQQIVEIGWTVDRGVNRDDSPHLFVFRWVNGSPGCYNGCGFVRNTAARARPGMLLNENIQPLFTISFQAGNWWLGYQSEWIGHFPGSLWGGGFTQTGLVQLFGEVDATGKTTCTDMGNGEPASQANSASIIAITYQNGPGVSLSTVETHPAAYTVRRVGSTSAHFGGPGHGTC